MEYPIWDTKIQITQTLGRGDAFISGSVMHEAPLEGEPGIIYRLGLNAQLPEHIIRDTRFQIEPFYNDGLAGIEGWGGRYKGFEVIWQQFFSWNKRKWWRKNPNENHGIYGMEILICITQWSYS
jgi:hypothetical protein